MCILPGTGSGVGISRFGYIFLIFLADYIRNIEVKNGLLKNEYKITETYHSCGSFKCSLLGIVFVHDHSIWISSSWNNHGSISTTTHNSSIMHYILWEILSIRLKKYEVSKYFIHRISKKASMSVTLKIFHFKFNKSMLK